MESCQELIDLNEKERFDDLSFEQDEHPQLPKMSPKSASKLVEFVTALEWCNHISKRLMESSCKEIKGDKQEEKKKETDISSKKSTPAHGKRKLSQVKNSSGKAEKEGTKPSQVMKTPPSGQHKRKLDYSVTPRPSVGKDAPKKPSKREVDQLKAEELRSKKRRRSPRLLEAEEENKRVMQGGEKEAQRRDDIGEQKERRKKRREEKETKTKEEKRREEESLDEEGEQKGKESLGEVPLCQEAGEEEKTVGEDVFVEDIDYETEGEEEGPSSQFSDLNQLVETIVASVDKPNEEGGNNVNSEVEMQQREIAIPTVVPEVVKEPGVKEVVKEPAVGQEVVVQEVEKTGVKEVGQEVERPVVKELVVVKEPGVDVVGQKPVVPKGGQDAVLEVSQESAIDLSKMDHPTFSLGLTPPAPKLQPNPKKDKEPNPKDIIYKRKPKATETKRQPKAKNTRQPPKRRSYKARKAKKQIREVESTPEMEIVAAEEDIEDLPYIADLPPLDIPFDDWVESAVIETEVKLETVPIKSTNFYKDWSYGRDSLFADNGTLPLSEPMEMPDENWDYGFRNIISEQQCRLLDDWAIKYFQLELNETDYAFKNSELNIFATVAQFKDLFSTSYIGFEMVEIACQLMQIEVPVNKEWFFLTSYVSKLAPKRQYLQLLRDAPQLFGPQFSTARWLFIPLCDLDHWILAAADLHNREIHMYNSCLDKSNDYYFKPHRETIRWMKTFLA